MSATDLLRALHADGQSIFERVVFDAMLSSLTHGPASDVAGLKHFGKCVGAVLIPVHLVPRVIVLPGNDVAANSVKNKENEKRSAYNE